MQIDSHTTMLILAMEAERTVREYLLRTVGRMSELKQERGAWKGNRAGVYN